MPTADVARLQRDLEDISARLRGLEAGDSHIARQLASELKDFTGEVRRMERKMQDMDIHGSAVTNERFLRYEQSLTTTREDISEAKAMLNVKADVKVVEEMRADQKLSRNMVRSALIAASFSLAVNIIAAVILFVVLGK